MTDEFVICKRCGSDACYKVEHEKSMHWQCMDCGFYTNTTMLKNSDVVDHIKSTSPELYKDLLFEDEDGLIWAPKVVKVPEVGTIFIDGTSIMNWAWCFMPAEKIPEEERWEFPDKNKPGEFEIYRTNDKKKRSYGQQDFIMAMEEAGLLNYAL